MKPSIVRVLCLAVLLPALLSGCDFSADDLEQVYGLADADGDGVLSNLDCAPDDPTVYPGATDPWGDDIDQDCDGGDGIDLDGDGAPAEGFDTPAEVVDCDDFDEAIHPGADEQCDETDSDCDGSLVDEDTDLDADGLPDCVDADADGDGADADTDCDDNDAALNLSDADGDTETSCDGDCNDADATVSTQSEELCDGQDNNCDDQIDEGLPSDGMLYYADADGDGYGDPDASLYACSEPAGHLTGAGDCDDSDASLNEDDVDGDGQSTCAGDCDDTDATLNLLDADGDGYVSCILEATAPAGDDDDSAGDDDDSAGDDDDSAAANTGPAGGDCNDADSAIHPHAIEACDDIDSDCDGSLVDEDLDTDGDLEPDCTDVDDDGDNHLDVVDCAPLDPTINPLAVEVCDTVDNNCDSVIDEDSAQDATLWYADLDGDSHAGSVLTQLACSAPSGFQASFDDCNDLDATSYPQAPELCDGSDNDCNLLIDDNAADATNWYADVDGDGYGDIGTVSTACDAPTGSVANATDCNDSDPAISPAATDVPGDGVDDDCNGSDAPLGTFIGDLTLTSNAGLSFFCSQYDSAFGSLTVSGSGVTDLSALSCLTEVYGDLMIEDTRALTLSLPLLSLVQGDLNIQSNNLATSASFPLLETVERTLWLNNQPQLSALDMPALTSVDASDAGDGLYIGYYGVGSELYLPQLQVVGRLTSYERGLVRINLPQLAEAGRIQLGEYMGAGMGSGEIEEVLLPALITVDNTLDVGAPGPLTSLDLSSLEEVGGLLRVAMTELSTLSLPSLLSAGDIEVFENFQLESVDFPALTVLEQLGSGASGDDDDDDSAGDDDDDDSAGDDDDSAASTSVTTTGSLTLSDNYQLLSLSAPSLESVGRLLLMFNLLLDQVDFSSLQSVDEELRLRANDALSDLSPFSGISTIESLVLYESDAITDLSPLYPVQFSGGGHFQAVYNCGFSTNDAWTLHSMMGEDTDYEEVQENGANCQGFSGDDDDSAAGDDDDSAAGDDDDSAAGDCCADQSCPDMNDCGLPPGDDDDSAAGDDNNSTAGDCCIDQSCPNMSVCGDPPQDPPQGPNCPEYCADRAANCSEDPTTCSVACEAAVASGMPLGTTNDTSGNTLGCRIYHTGVAGVTGDLAHCGHGNLFGGSSFDGFPCTDSLIEPYCDMALAACSGNIDNDGDSNTPDGPLYTDYAACATAAAAFPDTGTVGDTAGDSLQCRLYHVEIALLTDDLAVHCPHASPGGVAPCQ